MHKGEKMDKGLISAKCGEVFEWRKWMNEIPFIKWPTDWEVKAIPPFGGAVIRYFVKTPNCERVSIYLDCYDQLGFMQKPYWEVYPVAGDCERCFMEDTEELLKIIERAGKQNEATP